MISHITTMYNRWHVINSKTSHCDRIGLNCLGTFIWNKKAQAVWRRCLFFRSTTPFLDGVSTHGDWWRILLSHVGPNQFWHVYFRIITLQNTHRSIELSFNFSIEGTKVSKHFRVAHYKLNSSHPREIICISDKILVLNFGNDMMWSRNTKIN